MILLVNIPLPVPSDVLLSEVVGSRAFDQHTPLAVMAAPPLFVISPPPLALFFVVPEMVLVVTTGVVITGGRVSTP